MTTQSKNNASNTHPVSSVVERKKKIKSSTNQQKRKVKKEGRRGQRKGRKGRVQTSATKDASCEGLSTLWTSDGEEKQERGKEASLKGGEKFRRGAQQEGRKGMIKIEVHRSKELC